MYRATPAVLCVFAAVLARPARSVEPDLVALGFESSACGSVVRGLPGSTVRIGVTATMEVNVSDVGGYILSIDVSSPDLDISVGTEFCDKVCAAALLFPQGDGSEVVFHSGAVVDPLAEPATGPLSGLGPQGHGVVSASQLRLSPVLTLPSGTSRLLKFYVDVVVPEDVEGGEVVVSYLDGKQIGGEPVVNVAVRAGESDFPAERRSCSFRVAPGDPERFIRGDSNHDGETDLSDAIKTLQVLFLGDGTISCEDAADANDDGELDQSDAIMTLGVLFLGQGSIPPPGTATCGPDPSEDVLRCAGYPECRAPQ